MGLELRDKMSFDRFTSSLVTKITAVPVVAETITAGHKLVIDFPSHITGVRTDVGKPDFKQVKSPPDKPRVPAKIVL
jgi:hypothetical protein